MAGPGPGEAAGTRAEGRCTPTTATSGPSTTARAMRPVGLTATAGLSYLAVPAVGHHLRGDAARAASTRRPGSPTSTPTGSTSRCCTRASRCRAPRSTAPSPSSSTRASAPTTTGSPSSARGATAGWSARRSCRRPASTTAIAEFERALALGHRGVVISSFPNGTLDAAPEDDAVLGVRAGRRHPGRRAHRQLHPGDGHRPRADVRHARVHGSGGRDQGRFAHDPRRLRLHLLRASSSGSRS